MSFVKVSATLGVTAADLQAFNDRSMNPETMKTDVRVAGERAAGLLAGIEDTSEIMGAMVYMYDLTQDRIYLDHLREMSREVLMNRDDHRGAPVDAFTGRVMPAWGKSTVSFGSLHHANIFDAGLWCYPIAAFARIVGETQNLELRTLYEEDAVLFANAVAETLFAFTAYLRIRPAGIKRFVHPEQYRTLLTAAQCDAAYQEAVNGNGPEGGIIGEPGGLSRLNVFRGLCKSAHSVADRPLPHNKAHAFEMAMIEAWRAVDSPFHRERVSGNFVVDWARGSVPRDIQSTYRWFETNLRRGGTSAAFPEGWLVWNYADDVPKIGVEDTSHGNLSMRYVGVLHRSLERVNAALVAAGQEPIDLSLTRRQLANTFLAKIGTGRDLAHEVDGRSNDRPQDYYNRTCAGWLDLAQVDVRIYKKCHEVALRVVEVEEESGVERRQKYLTPLIHASLLFNKPRGGPPTTVPNVIHKTREQAALEIRAAGLLPSFTGQAGSDAWVEVQNPQPGEVIDSGNVVLCDTRGGPIPGPNQTRVPNVKDLMKEEAAAAITSVGLVPTFTGGGKWVGRQSPLADEVVNRGSKVRCTLRGGRPPEEKEEP
ncbi:MAG: PASTA domain-containing protein [Luteitalea sp.]|nr:PASTA domain-containing protein [Luteitalea sp.]